MADVDGCVHSTSNDFSEHGHGGTRIWRCVACKKKGFWTEFWRASKKGICPKCKSVIVNSVACSQSCANFLKSDGRW